MTEKIQLPPGQRLARDFPVLHFGRVPVFDPDKWDFRLFGAVRKPATFRWNEFCGLPQQDRMADFHCVTGWTRPRCDWHGVLFKYLAALVLPAAEAKFVVVHADQGYTTNLPLADMMEDDVILTLGLDKSPLLAIHGGPLRLVIPKKYAYKSVKWKGVRRFIRFMRFPASQPSNLLTC